MTFREAAQRYHISLKKKARARGSAAARRRRRELDLEEFVMPYFGERDLLEVLDELWEVENTIRSSATNDAWVAGLVETVRAVIRHNNPVI